MTPLSGRPRMALSLLVPSVIVAAAGAIVLATPGPAAAAVSMTFTPSSSAQPWQVPAGVTWVHLRAAGGGGANGVTVGSNAGGSGGFGGTVDADVAVVPGEVLSIIPGWMGTKGNPGLGGSQGGFAGASSDTTRYGNGGGSSSVTGGDGRMLVVAGGGGGGGEAQSTGGGGDGGAGGGNRGYAGHTTYAGSGGSGSSGTNNGGNGGNYDSFTLSAPGGGGGGGWNPTNTGGGAGGKIAVFPFFAQPGGGGAGGSSFSSTPGAVVGVAASDTDGSVAITFVPAVTVSGTAKVSSSSVVTGTPVEVRATILDATGSSLPANAPGEIQYGTVDPATGLDNAFVFGSLNGGSTYSWSVVLPPGQTTLYVAYSGGVMPDGTIYLPWRSADLTVSVAAQVSALTLTPNPLAFGTHDVGTSTTLTVTAANTGNVPWTSATIGLNPPDFRITRDGCGATAIAVGGTCSYDVTFTPSTAGPGGGTFSLTSTTGVTASVSLTGVGTAVVTPPPPPAPPAPTVTAISPTRGTRLGGTVVTITGTDLVNVTGVTFGTRAATNVTCPTATSCTATSPAGTGRVDVRVTTPAGTSPAVAADQFRYR